MREKRSRGTSVIFGGTQRGCDKEDGVCFLRREERKEFVSTETFFRLGGLWKRGEGGKKVKRKERKKKKKKSGEGC